MLKQIFLIVYSWSIEADHRVFRAVVVCPRGTSHVARRHHHGDPSASSSTQRRYAVSLAVPAPAAAQPRALSTLHSLDRPRGRHIQAGRHQVRVATVGSAQETAVDELRDNGTRSPVNTPYSVGGGAFLSATVWSGHICKAYLGAKNSGWQCNVYD